MRVWVLLILTGSVPGCPASFAGDAGGAALEDGPAPDDVRDPADASSLCASDEDCEDETFCNGPERCAPTEAGADERGCVVGRAPCMAGRCDEPRRCCGWTDADGDGYVTTACGGTDCDDTDAATYPGAADGCMPGDGDCDGRIDEHPDWYWYRDADLDGHGAGPIDPMPRCRAIDGWVGTNGDCDDEDATRHPGAEELCNGRDDDCNGVLDGPGEDDDRDRWVSALCWGGPLVDCDDHDRTVFPAGAPSCDPIDRNCDGHRDDDYDGDGEIAARCGGRDCAETDPAIGAVDADADGFLACGSGRDCDDTRDWIYPGAAEACDGFNSDCVGREVEDGDGDGFVATDAACRDDVPHARPRDDCWDWASSVHPGRSERCNGRDDDCDGAIDEDRAAVGADCVGASGCVEGVCRHVVSLSAGARNTCALLVDGTVRCWGLDLGCAPEDFTGGCYTPANVWGWTNIVALDPWAMVALDRSGVVHETSSIRATLPHAGIGLAVDDDVCIIRADTRGVYCRDRGDLAGPTDVAQLEIGCARTIAGAVWCWGENRFGEVGDGTTTPRAEPVLVVSAGAIDLAVSLTGRCAVLESGRVVCWGAVYGLPTSPTPTEVPGVVAAIEVAGTFETVAIVRRDQDVLRLGCLGPTTCYGESATEDGAIEGTRGLWGVVIGRDHGCGLTPDGRVACFGLDNGGRLGAPALPTGTRPQPVIVGGL